MIELRWVRITDRNRQLEYRVREMTIDNWGEVRHVGGWGNWIAVPTIEGDQAALEDLIASGGIVGAP